MDELSDCKEPADVVFVVDSSGSIGCNNFHMIVHYMQNIVRNLNMDEGTRVGLITFSTDASVIFHLNDFDNERDVLNAMNTPYIGGTTNTAEALRKAREEVGCTKFVFVEIYQKLFY